MAGNEQQIPGYSPSPSGRRLHAKTNNKSNLLNRFVFDGQGRTLAALAHIAKADPKCFAAANPHIKGQFALLDTKVRLPIKCLNLYPPAKAEAVRKAGAATFAHTAFKRDGAPRRRVRGLGRGGVATR